MRLRFSGLCLMAAVGVLSTQCLAKQIEVTIWTPFSGKPYIEVLEKMFKKFEAANPGVKVKHHGLAADGNTYNDKMLSALAGGVGPDVAWVIPGAMRDLLVRGLVVPVSELEKTGGAIQPNDFYRGLLDTKTYYKQTRWGIPFESGNLGLAYNKSMFAQAGLGRPPRTWSEMTLYCQKLTSPEKKTTGLEARWFSWYFEAIMLSNGGYLASPDGKRITWGDKPAVEAVQWYSDLKNKYNVVSDKIGFVRGAAMNIIGNWETPNYKNVKFDIGYAPLPHADSGVPATLSTAKELYVFRGRDKAKQAMTWRLVKTMMDDELFAEWCVKTGYLPVRRSQADTAIFKRFLEANPGLKAFVDQIDDAILPPQVPNVRSIGPIYDKAILAVVNGTKSAVEAMTEAARNAQALIKAR